ncbi:MAG: DUF4446 family protein [Nocardioidaceae bacterium]
MPFGPITLSWLSVAAVVIALVSLAVALAGWRRAALRYPSRSAALSASSRRGRTNAPLAAGEVAANIEALRSDVATTLRHLAVVRYDAFGDMGGHLSWSMALLDDGGDGVVLTSIHGRSDSRTYAKNVSGWSANQQLSPEEEQAIGFARSEA